MLLQFWLPFVSSQFNVSAVGQWLWKLCLPPLREHFLPMTAPLEGVTLILVGGVRAEPRIHFSHSSKADYTPGPKRLAPHLYLTLYGLSCSQQAVASCCSVRATTQPWQPLSSRHSSLDSSDTDNDTHIPSGQLNDITCWVQIQVTVCYK